MLEIIFIVTFGRKLGELAAGKGRSKGWAALGALFWIGGELVGFVIGALMGFQGLGAYPIALALAALGAFVAWMVVKSLPDARPAAAGSVTEG